MAKYFVGGISLRATRDDVFAALASRGFDSDQVFVPHPREDGLGRGFAFLTAPGDLESVRKALDGLDIGGRPVFVNEARPKAA